MDRKELLRERIAQWEQTIRELEKERADGEPSSVVGYGGELAPMSYETHISGLQEKIAEARAELATLEVPTPVG